MWSFWKLPYSIRSIINSFKCLSYDLALIMLTFLIFPLPLASRLFLTWVIIILRSTLRIILSFDVHNHHVSREDVDSHCTNEETNTKVDEARCSAKSLTPLQPEGESLLVQCSSLCNQISAHGRVPGNGHAQSICFHFIFNAYSF